MVQKIYDWGRLDPLLFSDDVRLIDIAREFDIPYRQVTNRKYQVRDRLQREMKKKLTFGEVYQVLTKEERKRGKNVSTKSKRKRTE